MRAFSQIRRFNHKWAVRTESHKLVYTEDTGTNSFGVPVAAGFELYDLEADPRERVNVYGSSPVSAELAEALLGFIDSAVRAPAPPAEPLSVEQQRRLRALGYLPEDPPGANDPPSAPGPTRRNE